MRRSFLIVAILLFAAPAMATVTVSAVQSASPCDEVVVSYTCTGGDEVRAFALDIVVDGNLAITGISGFQTGEGAKYGIFPGKFRDEIDPADPNWSEPNYNPIAPGTDPDALGGLDTNGITVELGALYTDGNEPASDGNLFTLQVRPTAGPVAGTLTITANAVRGGVVDVNSDAVVSPDLVLASGVAIGFPDCFPCWAGYTTQYGFFKQFVNDASCWCAAPTSTGNQCYGDADQANYGPFIVYTGDLTVLSNSWRKTMADTALNPCADTDHKAYGPFRVYTGDLTVLSNNWRATSLPGDCPLED